jgi:subfamily B ATP-binding cassette protein MsbA
MSEQTDGAPAEPRKGWVAERVSRFKAWLSNEDGGPYLVRRLLTEYGYGESGAFAFALLMGAASGACTAATAFIVGKVVNQAYLDRDMVAIAFLAVFVIVIFAVKGFTLYLHSVTLNTISNRIVSEIQRRTFDKLLIEGLGYFSNRHSTEFLAKVTNGARAAANVLRQLVTALGRDVMTLTGLVAVMLYQEPMLSVIGLVVAPPAIWFMRDLMRRTREISKNEIHGGVRVYETLQETIRGFPIVKAFSLEEEMRTRIRASINSIEIARTKLAKIENRTSPIMESLGGIAIALVLLYGGYRVIQLGATPGEFVSFITAFLLAYEPAKRIARLNLTLSRNLRGVRMLFEILDSPPTEPEEPETAPVAISKGQIRFVKVNFGYNPKERVLEDYSFVAEAGQLTALVGPSGGGKSTTVALLLRFYDPQEGRIEVDGINIARIPRRALRRQIAYVGQDVFLFRGTIGENIRYGKLDATEEEIIEAAKSAYAHDFIVRFPEGYDAPVGEGGARLSSGQRQRIAVARALVRNAPIILLDEATSALDSRAEREVQLAVDRLREGRTCIAIAHRLHTITQADRIYFLEHGRIVESGTHRELLKQGGRYAEYFHLQSNKEQLLLEAESFKEVQPIRLIASE